MTTSDYEPDYEWLRVTTSDYKWLPVNTSQTTSDCEWLQVTTTDCKRLRVKLRMTTTAISNNLKHKNVYRFLRLHNNKRSIYVGKCSKNSCGTLLVTIDEKYLRCRISRLRVFFKVRALKKFANFTGKHLC